jgi:hypothetical protein
MPAVGPPAGCPEYTRTWSIAINTMTSPRTTSIDVMRAVGAATALASVAIGEIPREGDEPSHILRASSAQSTPEHIAGAAGCANAPRVPRRAGAQGD